MSTFVERPLTELLRHQPYWHKKISSWDEVYTYGRPGNLCVLRALAQLPHVRMPDTSLPSAMFEARRPQWFVAHLYPSGRMFIVNTEGYPYVRYAHPVPAEDVRDWAHDQKGRDLSPTDYLRYLLDTFNGWGSNNSYTFPDGTTIDRHDDEEVV